MERERLKELMAYSKNCKDNSKLYSGFKDVNEWLRGNTINGSWAEGARCVFVATKTNLLYSRRSQRKKEMKKTYIKFRCSIYEKKLIRKRAERAGISLSEYCRSSAFGNSVIERLTEEQLTHYKMLVKYNRNFIRIGICSRDTIRKLASEVETFGRGDTDTPL